MYASKRVQQRERSHILTQYGLKNPEQFALDQFDLSCGRKARLSLNETLNKTWGFHEPVRHRNDETALGSVDIFTMVWQREIQSTKFETNLKISNSKPSDGLSVWVIGILDLFRISCFGFWIFMGTGHFDCPRVLG